MLAYLWPILLIIASNVCYNIAAKSTPGGVNPFASLLVTYLVSALATGVMFAVSSVGKDGILVQVRQINWSSVALGLSLVGLEFGYIMAYRAGWQVSVGSLVANIALAVILVFVGALFYQEKITGFQAIGILLCLAGLVFLNIRPRSAS